MLHKKFIIKITAWKVSKYGVISGPYFPVFRLNTGNYGPEITPYLDSFHAVNFRTSEEMKQKSSFLLSKEKLSNGSTTTVRVGYVKTIYLILGLFNTPCFMGFSVLFFVLLFLFFFGFDISVFLVDIN